MFAFSEFFIVGMKSAVNFDSKKRIGQKLLFEKR